MTNTFWEAVKISLWDFRPHSVDVNELEADDDTPGAAAREARCVDRATAAAKRPLAGRTIVLS